MFHNTNETLAESARQKTYHLFQFFVQLSSLGAPFLPKLFLETEYPLKCFLIQVKTQQEVKNIKFIPSPFFC